MYMKTKKKESNVYIRMKNGFSIKNWKPDNDIEGLKHLEIHHTTDEQFILVNGKAILITAERKDGKFETELTLMEKGKVYNVPKRMLVLFDHTERYKDGLCSGFGMFYGKQ